MGQWNNDTIKETTNKKTKSILQILKGAIKLRLKKSTLITMLMLVLTVTVLTISIPEVDAIASTQGDDSFLYHRFGASVDPTWKFWFVDGSTSNETSPDSQDVPSYARKFSPTESNTNLKEFKSTAGRWIVQADWKWDYDIGTAFGNFEVNKPVSGRMHFMSEAHVNRGWEWDAFYTEMPEPYYTHIFSNAIYKDNHVEADIWSENPEGFEEDTEYTNQWKFTPEEGETFDNLSKDFGHAHGAYIYQYWNPIHVASSHGDPMDKISCRDDLGTFGHNTNFNVPVSSTSSLSLTNDPDTIASETEYSIIERGRVKHVKHNINNIEGLAKYRQERINVLKQLPATDKVSATITFLERDLTEVLAIMKESNVEVDRIGFATDKGSGVALKSPNKSPQEVIAETETDFNIDIKMLNFVVAKGSVSELIELQDRPEIYLVDPAKYIDDKQQVNNIEIPESIYYQVKIYLD